MFESLKKHKGGLPFMFMWLEQFCSFFVSFASEKSREKLFSIPTDQEIEDMVCMFFITQIRAVPTGSDESKTEQ
jgi:hypothetical protein